MRGAHDSVETVNLAAAAIVSAESRIRQVTVPRRRWSAFFSVYWCFGSPKTGRRIGHAILMPDANVPGAQAAMPGNLAGQQPSIMTSFVAPPSSPSSFIQSEPGSVSPTPGGPFSSIPVNSFSSTGPASIFAVGPYAHETQLVSPPVFSAFTTEPSTAPLTPPPESMHLTTPSSPEVPFAKLLTSIGDESGSGANSVKVDLYQLDPGSPIGHLISPSSVCSGTTSPFPDPEFPSFGFDSFTSLTADTAAKMSEANMESGKHIPRHTRGAGSLLDGHITAAVSTTEPTAEHFLDQRVSFELTAEDFTRCLEKRSIILGESKLDSSPIHDIPEKARRSLSQWATSKEFKFDNADGLPIDPGVGSNWWANEKVTGTSAEQARKSWSILPSLQKDVS